MSVDGFRQAELSLEFCRAAITAACAKASELQARVCVAIVDAGGSLAAFQREPGAFLVSTDLSIDKAWTAAGFGISTAELGDLLSSESEAVREGLLRRPRLTIVPGGVPISIGGRMLGAIGVSGGTAEQDADIAVAGRNAIR